MRRRTAVGRVSEKLAEASRRAKEAFRPVTQSRLAALAADPDARQRLLALMLMRRRIDEGAPAIDYLSLARPLVEDPDNDCRWQALIVVGENVDAHPEEVWRVVLAHGDSTDADMRMGVAVVLLDDLLARHFDEYLPKVRAELRRSSARFADMVKSCWVGSPDDPRTRRLRKHVRNAARGRPGQS